MAWLENSLASFQSHLLDALLTAARNLHTPLSRANMQQQQPQTGNSLPKTSADAGSSAQIKSVLMNQVLKVKISRLRFTKIFHHCFLFWQSCYWKIARKYQSWWISTLSDMPVWLWYSRTRFYHYILWLNRSSIFETEIFKQIGDG